MAGPSVPEILSRLLKEARISRDDYDQFLTNFEQFQFRAEEIRRAYSGRWVAAFGGEFYNDNSGRSLILRMLGMRGGHYAYIEQIL